MRGSTSNPGNRFERLVHTWDQDLDPAAEPDPRTVFIDDRSRSVLTRNTSPDVPFAVGLNPYRGCEHGCSYCYARPYHEYLGMSAGLDFETRILVKHDAPLLLRSELAAPGWQPQAIGMSGATDCYQPVERRLGLTRACLEVLAEFRNPLRLITKNALVARDADLLGDLARHRAVSVAISITSLDQDLALSLEPRASVPAARLQALRRLADAGVPVGVMVAPVIPGLNDHEIPAILAAAAAHGAGHAGYQLVRLPHGVEELFAAWLERHRPAERAKVMARIRAVHGGGCDSPVFGQRNTGAGGEHAQMLIDLFRIAARKAGLALDWPEPSAADFRVPGPRQTSLFD
ncbi:MAG: PA0069 family radical SAM protein [Planctomycetes bacterium]|nr:PA0069 family radical SAM protein [Planctomycetota bacterium]